MNHNNSMPQADINMQKYLFAAAGSFNIGIFIRSLHLNGF